MAAAETSFLFTTEGLLALGTAIAVSVGAWVRAEFLARGAAALATDAMKAAKLLADECEKESRERADDVKRIALDAHSQCGIIQAGLSMFREQVASNYVNREMMRELEARLSADMDRISASVENMSHSIAASVEKLADRINRVLEGRKV